MAVSAGQECSGLPLELLGGNCNGFRHTRIKNEGISYRFVVRDLVQIWNGKPAWEISALIEALGRMYQQLPETFYVTTGCLLFETLQAIFLDDHGIDVCSERQLTASIAYIPGPHVDVWIPDK